ncbi:MAG: hypothetical protein JJ975_03685 [Bacteroidia bacterium]|nr:hypothetical protein [Bacteroidia bacterium]
MTISLIIFFIAIGLVFLLIEILVTPGIILGIAGLGFMAFGVFQVFKQYGSGPGNAVLLGVATLTVGIVLFALKSGVWTRMASKGTIASKAKKNVADYVQVGDKGKTMSALRPLGTGMFNGKKLEVRSEGEAVEAGSDIEVIRIERNKIFIKKI